MNRWLLLLLILAGGVPLGLGCDRSTQVVAQQTGAALPEPAISSDKIVDKNFDDLKFEMELDDKFERTLLTDEIEGLFGQQIRIRGYIFPTLKKRGLKQFILVRDNLECCFGPGAALFDCILVHMTEGNTAEFSIRPVAVEGKLSFDQFLDYDGTTRAIYRLDGDSVE